MSWRQVIRQNTYTQLSDHRAANAADLGEVYKTRPAGTPATPFAYVGDITTSFRFPGSTLRVQTTGSVEVVFLTDVVDNTEAKDELDELADGFVDRVSALPHYLGSNTSWDTIDVSDTSESVGGVEYSGVAVVIGGITGQEGGY